MSKATGASPNPVLRVLVEVPKRPEVLFTAEEVIAKLKPMSGEHFVGVAEQQVA